ncbi:MAG: type I-E CRISPR-associated protein Cas6/Cse3/CasE [Clostridiales bacterium]|nr:type I-E CRISPR-associated protein Cas6/Cse3/CasE [Clostridiales bacterium]
MESRTVSLQAATFEGLLTVTDAERFRRTLTEGVGRGKAYGLGLLTIVR